MNFLLITQYFPPESGSASLKMADLAKYIVYKKHNITVITSFPNYPYGKVYNGYRMGIYKKEKINGINIIRTPLYITSKRHSFKHRMINHISFMVTSIYGSFLSRKPDLIYYYSPPPFLGFSAWILGKYFRVPIVGEFNDLWPQAPIALGIIKNKYIKKIAEMFEKFIYDRTNHLFFYSTTMREEIIKRGIPKNKTEIHPLWVSTDEFCQASPEEVAKLKMEYYFDKKFIVMYAGYIGIPQGLNILAEIAQGLKNYKDILFVLVGDGTEKENIKKIVEKLGLKNIRFVPIQPKEKIPILLSAADILFVHLDPAPHRMGTIPAKILAYMSMGKPLIVGVLGETTNIIKESQSGILIKPRDNEAICKGILTLYNNYEMRERMGCNARDYAVKYFNKNSILENLETRLIEIAERK